ncbi:MAG: outer membrane lipoprotein carrier protein LolA [Alphaproteobacteria bacterium]|nr:outer membrane lipoprotein carrier protein LolA [Alphaproteobacteria bacterium]
MKKTFLALLFLLISSVAKADELSIVKKAENSLNALKTAHGMFKQYNADGSIFTGEFWIQKPGKIRFEYSYPNQNFIVSNGSFIFFWDDSLKQQTNAPLSYTPAGIILNDKINLLDDSDIEVSNFKEYKESYEVSLRSKENKDIGVVTLSFSEKDNKLFKWKVVDLNGGETIMVLEDVSFDVNIDKKKFRFKDPTKNPFKLN